MPDSKRTSTEGPTAASGDLAAVTLDAIEGLHRLLEQVSIYPPGHPIVGQSRDDAVAQIHRSLQVESPLEIRVEPESISIGSTRLNTVRCRSLGKVLFGLDVSAVEVQAGVAPDEILTLVQEIARLRAADRVTGVAEALAPERFPHVRVDVVDYGAFQFAHGARDRALSEDPEALWSMLSQSIIGGSGGAAAVSPEQLGHLLGEEISRMEDVGSGALTRELRRLTEDIGDLAPNARRDAEGRMNRLLASLPGFLRTELLRIELGSPAVSESAFAGRLRSAAVVTSIKALLEAVRGGERPPQDALALVNQLLRVSSIGPAARRSLEETATAATMGTAAEELLRLENAVHEMFINRDALEANPADYQDLIEFLAVQDTSPAAEVTMSWRDHFGDPSDGEATRIQALKIAIDQLRRPLEETSPFGALAYVGAATTALIEGDRFEIVLEALNAAEACARASKGDEPLQSRLRAYADDVLSPSRIVAVLERFQDKERMPEAASEWLRRAGARGLESVMVALASGPPPAVAASLHEIVLTYPAAALLEHTRKRIGDGWAEVRHLFPMLQRVPDSAVTEFLLRTLDHPEDLIRCEALTTLVARESPVSMLEPALLNALRDQSQHVVRTALLALKHVPVAESVDVIGLLVEGRLSRESAASVSIRMQAVRGLTRHGDRGWRRLSRSLDRLAWSFRAADSVVAKGIATKIRDQFDAAAASKRLRHWRWSPARLLSLWGGTSS